MKKLKEITGITATNKITSGLYKGYRASMEFLKSVKQHLVLIKAELREQNKNLYICKKTSLFFCCNYPVCNWLLFSRSNFSASDDRLYNLLCNAMDPEPIIVV